MSIYSQTNDSIVRPKIILDPKVSSFSVQDFDHLRNPKKSYNSPLAVIAHIDVNAFFAQVEQLKHGFTREDPVICVQWSSIIAVSYAARKYGINRMDNLKSAIKKCPHVIPLHTSVFRKGENFWRNVNSCNPADFPSPATHKVSLDPYRRESRKMQRIFHENCKIVEKASVDESFFDLGTEVYEKARELFPQLKDIDNCDDPLQKLPPIPNELPEWCQRVRGVFIPTTEELETPLSQNNEEEEEEEEEEENKDKEESSAPHRRGQVLIFRDWDDILIHIGSLITLDLRKKIDDALGYTTSCGVARVKTLAKLASGFKKPDNQTIIRNGSIAEFLKNFSIVDFWGLGGKTGDNVAFQLKVPHEKEKVIEYIRDKFSLEDLVEKLDKDLELATKVYKIVRGELHAPFAEKREPSMCSSKRFRGESVNNRDDCVGWIKVFAGDLFQRIKETNEEQFGTNYSKDQKGSSNPAGIKIRCPRSLSLHYVTLSSRISRSRQMAFPVVSIEDLEKNIFELGVKLLDEILNLAKYEDHELFPLGIMDLTLAKLEVVSGLGFIENFFKAEKPAQSNNAKKDMENGEKIERVPFVYESRKNLGKEETQKNSIHSMLKLKNSSKTKNHEKSKVIAVKDIKKDDKDVLPELVTESNGLVPEEYFCESCNMVILNKSNNPHFVTEHQDYHFAISYSTKLNGENMTQNILTHNEPDQSKANSPIIYDLTISPSNLPKLKANSVLKREKPSNKNKNKKAKLEKGQSMLPF